MSPGGWASRRLGVTSLMQSQAPVWKSIGRCGDCSYYEVEPGFLLVVPDQGACDTGESAEQQKAFQLAYCSEIGGRSVVGILYDNVRDQTRDAREVYRTWPSDGGVVGSALIGGTVLARAMISFFVGLSTTDIPTRSFPNVEDARLWARSLTGR